LAGNGLQKHHKIPAFGDFLAFHFADGSIQSGRPENSHSRAAGKPGSVCNRNCIVMTHSSLAADARIACWQPASLGWHCPLVWLLCGAISAQAFLLPQAGALPRFCESQRQSEEESDPVESPYEEQQGQLFAAPSGRDRSFHSCLHGRRVMHSTTHGRVTAGRSGAFLTRPAELIFRNGSGSPLRC
jgi:hypothetical protein